MALGGARRHNSEGTLPLAPSRLASLLVPQLERGGTGGGAQVLRQAVPLYPLPLLTAQCRSRFIGCSAGSIACPLGSIPCHPLSSCCACTTLMGHSLQYCT